MTAFYRWVYVRMGEGRKLSQLLMGHGLLYGVLGFGLCIPFVGILLAQLTPIGRLIFGILMWTPLGYPGLLCVAILFVLFNAYLICAEVESSQNGVANA